jgi:hypothetical protein
MKKIYINIIKGIILAWKTPMLPDSILKLNKNIIIRILQIINIFAISIILINDKILLIAPISYIILILFLINIIYFLIISLIKIIYSIKQIYNLDPKNYNLNIYSGIIFKLSYYCKIICSLIIISLILFIINIIIGKILVITEQIHLFNLINENLSKIVTIINTIISKINNIQDKFTNFSWTYFNNLNFINFCKLVIIVLLIFINIYLIWLSNERNPYNNELKKAGMDDRLLTRLIGMTVTSVGLTSFFKRLRIDKIDEVTRNIHQNLNILQTSLEYDDTKTEADRRAFYAAKREVYELIDWIKANKIKDKERLDELIQLQGISIPTTSSQRRLFKDRIRDLSGERTSDDTLLEWQVRGVEDTLIKATNLLAPNDRNNFVLNEINFSYESLMKFFDQFSSLEKLAIVNLIFSQMIISSLLSLIFIFYGEYLIKYFNLENKYPKLAKFIQFRKKFQLFFFIWNILWIFSIVLIQIYVYFEILSYL